MPTHSPLPMRHGLRAAWVRTPDRDPANPMPWASMRDFLRHRLPAEVDVDAMLADGRFVDDDGRPWNGDEIYRPHTFVHFHRDLRPEPELPFELDVLHVDERIVVVDKPHFMASIPRGRHVTQSVVVKAREMLDLPELGPAHRLDRLTAGVLVLTTEQRWRAPYQRMFEARVPAKTYEALAPLRDDLELPRRVESHIRKDHGTTQAYEVAGAAINAVTDVHLEERRVVTAGDEDDARVHQIGLYRLEPSTGRTHQLRVHMSGLGVPICGDPLYPRELAVDIDDYSTPLQLLARRLEFVDPLDGRTRVFTSRRELTLGDAT